MSLEVTAERHIKEDQSNFAHPRGQTNIRVQRVCVGTAKFAGRCSASHKVGQAGKVLNEANSCSCGNLEMHESNKG